MLSPSQPNPIGPLDDQVNQPPPEEKKPIDQAPPATIPDEEPPEEAVAPAVMTEQAARLDNDEAAEQAPSALDLAFAAGVFLSPYVISDAPALLDERRNKLVPVRS